MNLTDSNEYFTETKQFSQPVELPSNPAHIRTQVCRKIKKIILFSFWPQWESVGIKSNGNGKKYTVLLDWKLGEERNEAFC